MRGQGRAHEAAVRELHELLLRASHHEMQRRAGAMGIPVGSALRELAEQCAADAVVDVIARLDTFEGRSRFTTWVYKFAIHNTGVAVRRYVWRERELPTGAEALDAIASCTNDPQAQAEQVELLEALTLAIAELTPRQREVLLALAVNGVPIDVLADRLDTTRGALYKVLHDARVALRGQLAARGLDPAARAGGRP